MAGFNPLSYHDALFHAKRKQIYIGLTGYTGSGCSTTRRLFESPQKPALSEIDEKLSSPREKLIHSKLARVWEQLDWQQFLCVEVSKVIFAFGCARVLTSTFSESPISSALKEVIFSKREQLDSLSILFEETPLVSESAKKLTEVFKVCESLFLPFKKRLGASLAKFIELMQDGGDQIRRFGCVFPDRDMELSPDNLFAIPKAVHRLCEAYRVCHETSHFVIDAFRNPIEVEYFKRHYSEFHLVGVFRDPAQRKASLENLSKSEVNTLDARERGKTRELSPETAGVWATTQNVEECLRKADFFIENKQDNSGTHPHLRNAIIKLLALAMNPGCIPPTDDERSMQLAMTARQMSGCISRRVGAVVVSSEGFVLGVGWNDPPSGQVPCALRTGKQLVDGGSPKMFSEFERSEEFVGHIKSECYSDEPFCFRTEYGKLKGSKQAEFTRALHAEENALFQALRNAGDRITGGTLYTTASTCTLCAKKAYELGIVRIVFIDEYPGIAIEQTLKAGNREIKIDQFDGVSGSAYHWLFEPIMPEKDLMHFTASNSPLIQIQLHL